MQAKTASWLALCGLAISAGGFQQPAGNIDRNRLREHLKTLASDEYEGRAPGTRGERLTVDYVTRQFKSYGLRGGNPDGSYEQAVPLVSSVVRDSATLTTRSGTRALAWAREFWAIPFFPLPADGATLSKELVFAGYGIRAPEFGWDDYGTSDVRGKIVVVLSGTPRSPRIAADNPRWTTFGSRGAKIRAAIDRGAVAVLVVYEPAPNAPTLEQSVARSVREIASAPAVGGATSAGTIVSGLIAPSVFSELAAASGRDVNSLLKAASDAPVTPFAFDATLTVQARRTDRSFTSPNIVAVLPGSDPARRDETIIYTGHWDHLGRDEQRAGDQIYNGAVDNAGGVAQLLEIARAFSRRAPKRTVLFIVTTAEEEGLLGANYYIAHPLFPLNKTVADINLDGFWPFGELRDLVEFGAGNTTFDDLVLATSTALHRRLIPDPMPAEHFYQRSDQWPFALAGVPGIFPSGWPTPHPEDPNWHDVVKAYLTDDYHKVSDEYHANWDLVGAVDDAEWMLEFGWRLAQSPAWAKWKADAPCQPCRVKGDAIVR